MHEKLFINLQEVDGKFGEKVVKDVINYSKIFKNLVIVCSSSGKLESKHVKIWFDECANKLVDGEILFLLDSYGCHKSKKKELSKENLEESNVDQLLNIEIIPASTTSMIQPLDKYYFRQFKIVYRKIVSRQVQLNIKYPNEYKPVHLREIQLKLVSIVHQQFRAPSFRFMIKGSWDLCGYSLGGGEIQRFENANKVLFDLDKTKSCCNCSKASFIKCAWCREIICFDCFLLNEVHFHFDDSIQPTILDYHNLNMVKKSKKNLNKDVQSIISPINLVQPIASPINLVQSETSKKKRGRPKKKQ